MKTYKVSDIEKKRVLGRTLPVEKDKALTLFWAASALEINVKSSEVYLLFSADYDNSEPWVSVYINGAPVSRFMVEKGQPRWVCLARNMNPENENLITVYKDTQPMTGEEKHSLFIHEVGLSDSGEFCELAPRKLKLEFIGDSITSGEGLAGSPNDMDWITQWFVGSSTYAAQTARALNADFSVISQCGWGLCWGWDGNRNSRIPPYYEQVCGVMWGESQEKLGAKKAWDFKGGSDFVIINLGTNDNGAFFQPPWQEAELKDKYRLNLNADGTVCTQDAKVINDGVRDFLKTVRKNNPNAVIIWCWGMIKLDLVPPLIQSAIEEYMEESGDQRVCTLELDSMEMVEKLAEDKGSRGHPGPKTHRLAAMKLSDFIAKLS
jgi:lysophospholipase L1-like esterase